MAGWYPCGNTARRPDVRIRVDGPNPLRVALSVLAALRVRRPAPAAVGADPSSWESLGRVLSVVRDEGITALPSRTDELRTALQTAADHDPDQLSRDDALAYWLNLYNAGALSLAAEALRTNANTVLRVAGAFTDRFITVAGEHLSLTQIEHGKIRRFKDPRIHTALVCGSVSCPTLRYEPFAGKRLSEQLDEQARTFLASGGALRESDRLLLSRVFLWYGADYGRPHRMPAFLPVSKERTAGALVQWMEPDLATWVREDTPPVSFQPYDWALACSVR